MFRETPLYLNKEQKFKRFSSVAIAISFAAELCALPRPHSSSRTHQRKAQDVYHFQQLLNIDSGDALASFGTYLGNKEQGIVLVQSLRFWMEVQRYKRLCHGQGNPRLMREKACFERLSSF